MAKPPAAAIGILPQPYFAGVARALEALSRLGTLLPTPHAEEISTLIRQNDNIAVVAAERILDHYTLTKIVIKPDGYAHATAGGAEGTLVEQGWRSFLVRVFNPNNSTASLSLLPAGSVYATALFRAAGASRPTVPDSLTMVPYVSERWLASKLYDAAPAESALTGSPVEYRVIQLYSRDRGSRSADLTFITTTGPLSTLEAKLIYRRGLTLTFDCLPSRDVILRVRDEDGCGCTAGVTLRDHLKRVYPLQSRRLAPDMQFQPQIYRADGETVRLPDGEYTVESTRGPEYLCSRQEVTIGESRNLISIQLQRWIDPSRWGWYAGDTHLHAAGCAHYDYPTQGVSLETTIRQLRGEALSIGEILTWGPSWYYQKKFFTGRAESPSATLEHRDLQEANRTSLDPRVTVKDAESLLRWDVELSGFPSSHCGHPVLLNLKEQDYPGTEVIEDWPSWNLPILVGPRHKVRSWATRGNCRCYPRNG